MFVMFPRLKALFVYLTLASSAIFAPNADAAAMPCTSSQRLLVLYDSPASQAASSSLRWDARTVPVGRRSRKSSPIDALQFASADACTRAMERLSHMPNVVAVRRRRPLAAAHHLQR